jgi:hypothetical protein
MTMRAFLGNACLGLLILSVTAIANADFGTQLPEPGVLELAGIGAVAAIVAKLARRRK